MQIEEKEIDSGTHGIVQVGDGFAKLLQSPQFKTRGPRQLQCML